MQWIHCGGIEAPLPVDGPYAQAACILESLQESLALAGADLEDMVRTWFYQGGITAVHQGAQRYCDLNRARSDCYESVSFGRQINGHAGQRTLYPASTGIGVLGRSLGVSCLALKTDRRDVRLVALENPGQVPAYCYDRRYSPSSPKFSRAMAVLLGGYATTWISGTASIVNSESCHQGDVEWQTHQTLDNIERLIAPENFALCGVPRAGAGLEDLAKVRVYVKRPEDYVRCRAICEQRLGDVPTIYAIADVCRPELLVEIEGVAFSPVGPRPRTLPERAP
jgi:enamine deaminase RidA (YjgF/YER057c/UK114 family)